MKTLETLNRLQMSKNQFHSLTHKGFIRQATFQVDAEFEKERAMLYTDTLTIEAVEDMESLQDAFHEKHIRK